MLLIIKSQYQCILLCSLIKYAYTLRGGKDVLSHTGTAISNLSALHMDLLHLISSRLLSTTQLDVSTFNDSVRLVGVEEADGAGKRL